MTGNDDSMPCPISLKELEWAEIRLTDYFSPVKGNVRNMGSLKDGPTPLVSAKSVDNGYKRFVASDDVPFKGHCLTINNDGDGGAGIAFYQPADMMLDAHVTALIPKLDMSRYTLLFVATCITKQRDRFGHGYSINTARLGVMRIMLPVHDGGVPAWDAMDTYMRCLENELLDEYLSLIKARAGGGCENPTTSDQKFGTFRIGDLFRLERGRCSASSKLTESKAGISYVGATNANNGVVKFVVPEKGLIQEGRCMAFISNGQGSIGLSVYKEEDMIASQDVVLGYNPELDRYTGAYITTASNSNRLKYNFGYKRSIERLSNEQIALPIDDSGQPDWNFMRAHMRSLESDIAKTYAEHINRTRSAGGKMRHPHDPRRRMLGGNGPIPFASDYGARHRRTHRGDIECRRPSDAQGIPDGHGPGTSTMWPRETR